MEVENLITDTTKEVLNIIDDVKLLYNFDNDQGKIDLASNNLKKIQQLRLEQLNKLKQSLKSAHIKLRTKQNTVKDLTENGALSEVIKRKDMSFNEEAELNRKLREVNSKKTSLANSISRFMDELNEIERQFELLDDEPLLENVEDKSALLKLAFYRSFGVSFDDRKNLVIIFNKREGYSDFLELGGEKYSDFFVTNYIWDRV
ncbi:hypothetical protein WICPIJ_003970 [Wickerhamomyces pijperi]|uniref:Kinetochore protein Spc24 n=1 Tax=Wickerhamomyces pijperi TaxID=599730 RepID=A0A9P8Q6I7_WICPI|nr:hypothetical protein WICPIJ_003970 [Wickerhamomyces pijperi]